MYEMKSIMIENENVNEYCMYLIHGEIIIILISLL